MTSVAARCGAAVAILLIGGIAQYSAATEPAQIPAEYAIAMKAECRARARDLGDSDVRSCLRRMVQAALRPGAIVDLAALPKDRRDQAVDVCVHEMVESVAALDRCLRTSLSQQLPAAAQNVPSLPVPTPPDPASPRTPIAPSTFPPVMAETLDCATTKTLPTLPPVSIRPSEARSVSLGVLQAILARCEPAGNCPPDVLHLGGLTSIDGLTLDRDRNDLVIWGSAIVHGDVSAGISTEDLAFALRSAWGRYDEITPTVHKIIPAVLSIDPDPATMIDLRTMGDRTMAMARKDFAAAGNAWVKACARPQSVRLEGVPVGIHAAQVLLQADYDLKHVADGTIEMSRWGVESMERQNQKAFQSAVCHARSDARTEIRMDRFWFHGGKLIYAADASSVELETVELRLSTEAQMLSHRGNLTGQSRPSPEADRFVSTFQQHMTEVGQVLPIYHDLATLFRIAGLAVAVHDALGETAASRLSWLLDRQPLRRQTFPKLVSGRGRFTSTSIDTGDAIHRTFGASCGGVELWFDQNNRISLSNRESDLAQVARRALLGRPPGVLSWPHITWHCP